jgi:hypothetical protein
MVPAFVRLFPEAKFLVPIRDVISWLDSYLDYGINNRLHEGTNVISPQRTRMGRHRYGQLYQRYSDGEEKLRQFDMPSIEAHLYFYRNYYEKLLKLIPDERRIVYSTKELNENLTSICNFLGISNTIFLNTRRKRLNTRRMRHNVLMNLDPVWFQEKIEYYCGHLIKSFFPDMQTYNFIENRL